MKTLILRIFVWVSFLMAACSPASSVTGKEEITNYSHIKVGAQNFFSSYLSGFSDADKATIKKWQAQHLDIATGGTNLLPYNPNIISGGYVDHVYIYPHTTYKVKNVANTHGYIAEDMFWHMTINYQTLAAWAWSGMDQFDVHEVDAIGRKINGVFLLNGNKYTDKTVAAYDTTGQGVKIDDKLLVGYAEPFADINFILSTAAVGKSVAIEYWNGTAWAALIARDDTNGLKQNGLVTFTPPADWAKTAQNGSRPKWWVRFVVSGSGTSPVASRIFGDNWLASDGANNCRGWDATSPTILNKGLGELEYNPTPPATATAKFRYQARTTGMWAHNAIFGNPSNVQLGERTWATFNAQQAIDALTITNGNGMMFDDGNAGPGITAPKYALSAYSDFAGPGTMQEERTKNYAYSKSLIKARFPSVKVGTLSMTKNFVDAGDWNMNESFADVINIASSTRYAAGDPSGIYSTSFDGYLPENNPNNVAGIMMFMDTYAAGKLDPNKVWFYWDRGNRGPLVALAAYYMGANNNTYFAYNISGTNYQYYGSPGTFHYWSPSATELTQNLDATDVAAPQDIYGTDFSAFPATAMIRVGDNMFKSCTKISNTQLRTVASKVYSTVPKGARIQFVVEKNMALDAIPPNVEFESWGMWFPAIAVDVGQPTETRNTAWKLWNSIGGSSASSGNIWKRNYTNALILLRPSNYSMTASQVTTSSSVIDLGGTYYPLLVTGKTGVPVTTIQLRTGEGAILMKAPVR